jgi:hypothetical protein
MVAVERRGAKMDDQILSAIDEEIAKLRQVRAILAGSGQLPAGKNLTAAAAIVTHSKPRRKLSAKARKAIADAQRKRWAKAAKSQKKTATPSSASKKPPAAT